MAASSLTALLAGGNDNAAIVDPTMAGIQNDLQTGQALTEQGISTAPASPWQALARVTQAATGNYIKQGARSDLTKLYAHTGDHLKQIFPAGTPVGDMLASGDPATVMMGIQLAPKVGLVKSEPYSLPPGETRYEGAKPIVTSNQPVSSEGKQIADAARLAASGNPAAARAITSTVSKGGQIGETGVTAPPIPLNAPRLGGPGSGIGQIVGMGPGGPGTPSAQPPGAAPAASPPAVPLPAPRPAGVPLTAPNIAAPAGPVQNAGVPTTAPNFADRFAASAPQGVPSSVPAAAPPTAPPPAKAPPTAVPSNPLQGSVPAQIAASKGAQKDAEITGEQTAKYFDSLHKGLAGTAMVNAQQKQNLDGLRQIATSPNFTPGAGSDAALALQRMAAQFGINPTGAAPRELFNQLSARVLADQFSGLKSMSSETGETGARIFKPMLDLEEKANITHEDSLAGIKAKLDLMDKAGDLMMKWGNMSDDYLKTHPRLDAQFEKDLRAEIGNARIPNIVPTAAAQPANAGALGGNTVSPAASPHSREVIEAEMRRRGLLK